MSSNFTATNAEGYELLMGRWSRHLAEPCLDFVGLPASGRVLDVGCGTASLTRAIAKRMEGEVVGVDIVKVEPPRRRGEAVATEEAGALPRLNEGSADPASKPACSA